MKQLHRKTLLFLVILILFLCGSWFECRAGEPNSVSNYPKSSGGYCGIYCLYAAMKYFGVQADPNELLKPEYIGSVKGSSLAELKKAAEKHGLYAIAVDRITTKDLRELPLPVIIHVKSSPTGKKYDHYFLFLGSREEQALIYDPPNPIELVEFWALAPRWDGSGLLISNKPIRLNAVFASSRLRFVIYSMIVIAVVLTIRWALMRFYNLKPAMSRKSAIALSFVQCAILFFAAVCVAFTYHYINNEGLLLRKQATENIQKAYRSSFASKTQGKRSQLAGEIK